MIGISQLLAALGFTDKKPPPTSSSPAGEGVVSASALVAETAARWHVLTIDGYSNVKALVGTGKCVTTRTFTVGGHRWHIKYYPNGEDAETSVYISIYLIREQDAAAGAGDRDVSAWFRFTLLDHGDNDQDDVPWEGFHKTQLHTWKADGSSEWGYRMLIHRSKLEGSRSPAYLRNDCIRIRCDIVVSKKEILRRNSEERDDGGTAVAGLDVDVVPPPDVGMDLLQLLLWDEEGSDVSFEVAGETLLAHRYILAARSPVFMAELYGPMKEMTEPCVRIHDMEAPVFKMLLHFIYTDRLPEMDKDAVVAMSQHLLVAADRYCLERLKLICENNLCHCINVSTVGTSLALAEQHNCQGLKKACVQFLKSSSNLKAALATDGFDHLTTSCPNVLEELLAMVAP